MDSYEHMLTAGGKTNSLGRANEVIDSVYRNPSRLNELFNCISADDPWVRMRAIDSFEKIVKANPEWALPYMNEILHNLTMVAQPSIQWHLAQIFSEVQLTDEQRVVAIAWLKNKIKNTNVDWIVAANTMKALVYFHRNGFIKANELLQLFKVQEKHKSKSVRKKAVDFQRMLN